MTVSNPPIAAARAPSRSLVDGPVLPWALAVFGLYAAFGPGEFAAALRDFTLPDTDDAMRLVEVRDLVAGQAWFDMIQHRFLPPAGVASHWSRLVDAPLAAVIAALTPLVGGSLAERITAAFWPPLLFLTYAAILGGGMRTLFGGRAALFGIFAATQTFGLLIQFRPGRIDHHNVQIILLLGVGLALMRPSRSWRTGAVAGALAAGSLAVGLEALPLVAIAGLIAVVDWWLAGRPALPALAGFGLSLAGGATVLFGLQTAPALWTASACDALSPPWLWIAGMGAALPVAAIAMRPDRRATRFALASGVGLIGLAGFGWLFPSCLHGPFTDMPDFVRVHWLARVREMQPLSALLQKAPSEAVGLLATLYAAAIAAVVLAIVDVAHRRTFTIAGLILVAGAVQTLFQLRGMYVASAFGPLVAGICLDRALPTSAAVPAGRFARIALLVAVLALNGRVRLTSGQIFEQAAGYAQNDKDDAGGDDACRQPAALSPLGALPTGTVLAPIDLGPHLLVHTPHSVVAAPYHRAIAGLSAGLAVSDGTEDEVRRQAAATHATYLVLCAARNGSSFGTRLARGETTADWLTPIPLEGSALKAWRIR